jgi:hypothetical protein
VAAAGLNVCSACILEMAELVANEHPAWREDALERLQRTKKARQ